MTKRRSAWLLFAISIAVGCASTGPGELVPIGDDHTPPGAANGPPGNPNGPAPNPNGAPCTGSTTAEELFQIASDAICAHAAACGDTGGGKIGAGGGGGQGGGDGGFGGEGNFGGADFGGAAGFQGDWAPGAGKSLTVHKLVDKLLSYKGQPPLQSTLAQGDNGGFSWGAFCALFSGLIEECKAHPAECEIEGPAVIPVCASSVQACMQAIMAMIPCDPVKAETFELDTLPPACAGLGSSLGGEGGSGGSGGQGGSGGFGGDGGGGFGGGGTCEYPNCGGCTDTCGACLCANQGNQTVCSPVCGGGGGGTGATGGFGATGGTGATGGFGGMDGGDCVNPTCSCPDACTTCMCIYADTTFCASYCGG